MVNNRDESPESPKVISYTLLFLLFCTAFMYFLNANHVFCFRSASILAPVKRSEYRSMKIKRTSVLVLIIMMMLYLLILTL